MGWLKDLYVFCGLLVMKISGSLRIPWKTGISRDANGLNHQAYPLTLWWCMIYSMIAFHRRNKTTSSNNPHSGDIFMATATNQNLSFQDASRSLAPPENVKLSSLAQSRNLGWTLIGSNIPVILTARFSAFYLGDFPCEQIAKIPRSYLWLNDSRCCRLRIGLESGRCLEID